MNTTATHHALYTNEILLVSCLRWSLYVVTVHSPTFPIPWLRCSTLKTGKERTFYLGRVEVMVGAGGPMFASLKPGNGPAFRLNLLGWEVSLGRG